MKGRGISMSKTILKTETDVRDFARGCTLLGTGGGGLEENGVEGLLSELNAGREISWIDVDDVPDDALTACPFLMGTIAPHTEETIKEMATYNMTEKTELYKEKDRISHSITELEEYIGKKIQAVVPLELGGASTCGCLAAGVANGIPAVNGDYTGRAIPEIPQTTPYLKDYPMWPLSVVDAYGNVSIIKSSINHRVIEKMGKKLSEVAYGLTGDTGFLFTGKEMKEVILKGTLTRCLKLGRLIRETNEAGGDPVAAIVEELGGWILCRGKLATEDTEDKEGYYWGYHTVEGTGDFAGKTAKVWFKNENHVCWVNDEVVASSPDSVIIINDKTAMPCTNPRLAGLIGTDVAVIGLKAVDIFRSEKGVSILGPRYFGFDFDYIPIEKRLAKK